MTSSTTSSPMTSSSFRARKMKTILTTFSSSQKHLFLVRGSLSEIKLFKSFTTVTKIPVDESLKSKAIPEQTAPGKESTNPLIADALLKSITKDITNPNPCKGKISRLIYISPAAEGISKMTTLSINKFYAGKPDSVMNNSSSIITNTTFSCWKTTSEIARNQIKDCSSSRTTNRRQVNMTDPAMKTSSPKWAPTEEICVHMDPYEGKRQEATSFSTTATIHLFKESDIESNVSTNCSIIGRIITKATIHPLKKMARHDVSPICSIIGNVMTKATGPAPRLYNKTSFSRRKASNTRDPILEI